MDRNRPKISVIMPVYNAEAYLRETIDSILNQTFSDFELIILNDNSNDNSEKLILDYIEIDNRIIYIKKTSNFGPALLRNEGIAVARGEFIALNDADDVSSKLRFEKQIDVLEKNSKIGVCGSWYTVFGKDIKQNLVKTTGNSDEFKVLFLSYNCIGNSTTMFRKSLAKNVFFDKNFTPCEDYKFWSEIISNNDFFIIQESLLKYRLHNNNISKTKIDNVKISNDNIKLSFICKELNIPVDKINKDYLLNIINYKKNADINEIKELIKYSKQMIEYNIKTKKFNLYFFERRINYMLIKSIKKSKNIDFNFIKYLKKNESNFYNKIPLLMKIYFNLKAIFG